MAERGFGALTETDMQAGATAKLGERTERNPVLGACNSLPANRAVRQPADRAAAALAALSCARARPPSAPPR
ncbi:hypothetical protein [Rhodococcus wratislaviensis]|uniref:hypothetical protein n=1 Tax=Rhodococcus wratislaviensis TaxID=44752 RepID=UPI0035191C49